MNVINLTGRVVKDCELSMLPGTGTAKISFTLCVERKYQKDKNNKKVDFIPVERLGSHTDLYVILQLSQSSCLLLHTELISQCGLLASLQV